MSVYIPIKVTLCSLVFAAPGKVKPLDRLDYIRLTNCMQMPRMRAHTCSALIPLLIWPWKPGSTPSPNFGLQVSMWPLGCLGSGHQGSGRLLSSAMNSLCGRSWTTQGATRDALLLTRGRTAAHPLYLGSRDMIVPARTVNCFLNSKPWIISNIERLLILKRLPSENRTRITAGCCSRS